MPFFAQQPTHSRRGLAAFAVGACLLAWLVVAQPALAEGPAVDDGGVVGALGESAEVTAAGVTDPIATATGALETVPPEEIATTAPATPVVGEEVPATEELLTILPAEVPEEVAPPPEPVAPPVTEIIPVVVVTEPPLATTPDVALVPNISVVPPAPPADVAPSPNLTADAVPTPVADAPSPISNAHETKVVDFSVSLPEPPPDEPVAGVAAAPVAAEAALRQDSERWSPPSAAPGVKSEVAGSLVAVDRVPPSIFEIADPVAFVLPSGGFLQLLVAYITPGELSHAALPPLTQLLMVLVALALVRPRPRAERIADRHRYPRQGHHGLVLRPG